MTKKEVATVRLNELKEGESPFESRGMSVVKVTHGGEVKRLEIPIKSSGISELVDSFQRKAPTPPAKKCKVEAGSEQATDLGINTTQWVYLSDFADEGYQEELRKHNSNLGMKIVLNGLDVSILDKDGTPITDDEQKVVVLKGMGITGEQFTQIVDDISLLTKWEDENESDFLQR